MRRGLRGALTFAFALALVPALGAQQAASKSSGSKPAAAASKSAPAVAEKPAQKKTIERFLTITDMERVYTASLEASMNAQLQANPQMAQFEDIFREFMKKHASYKSLKPDLVTMYAETFTEADMLEAIKFYETPFGKRLLTKMPELMARGNEIGARRVRENLPELVAKVEKRMKQQGK